AVRDTVLGRLRRAGVEVKLRDLYAEGFQPALTRDEWVAQAKILAAGGETEFSQRVEDGKVY
ncbi:MAG: hypothetical protein AAFO58_12065, partial [Pseudomonadota bacterium]